MTGRVVVVGSANVDLVWHGPQLPRPGETVTDGTFTTLLGGKGANQAAAVAALGGEVAFVGCVGRDDHGALVRADLIDRGVDCSHLTVVDEPTGVALITVDASGENSIAVAPGANRSLTPDAARAAVEALASDGDAVLCSLEISVAAARAALRSAHERGAHAALNPAPARALDAATLAELLPPGALLTPNEGEAEHFGGMAALAALDADVVVTLGRRGATLHTRNAAPATVPGFEVDAVDTTGAGDAFNGALAWAIADGRSLAAAVPLASAAGALATRSIGARASLASHAELDALIATHPTSTQLS